MIEIKYRGQLHVFPDQATYLEFLKSEIQVLHAYATVGPAIQTFLAKNDPHLMLNLTSSLALVVHELVHLLAQAVEVEPKHQTPDEAFKTILTRQPLEDQEALQEAWEVIMGRSASDEATAAAKFEAEFGKPVGDVS